MMDENERYTESSSYTIQIGGVGVDDKGRLLCEIRLGETTKIPVKDLQKMIDAKDERIAELENMIFDCVNYANALRNNHDELYNEIMDERLIQDEQDGD